MEIRIKDEFIKLGQALKLAGVVEDGVEAKYAINDGLVLVNGEVDSVTPMERQEAILNMIIDICHTEFEFDNFNEVMDYFKRMINVCKQMNYSKFKSEQYEGFQQQLKELIAERSVK